MSGFHRDSCICPPSILWHWPSQHSHPSRPLQLSVPSTMASFFLGLNPPSTVMEPRSPGWSHKSTTVHQYQLHFLLCPLITRCLPGIGAWAPPIYSLYVVPWISTYYTSAWTPPTLLWWQYPALRIYLICHHCLPLHFNQVQQWNKIINLYFLKLNLENKHARHHHHWHHH